MFDRFNEHARVAMTGGRDRAARLGHDAIASEHVFMALVAQDDDLPARAVLDLGIVPEAVGARIEELMPRRPPIEGSGPLPFTRDAKRMLETALSEARRLGDAHIGTEHLFLGVLDAATGFLRRSFVTRALQDHGVKVAAVRAELLRLIAVRDAGTSE